MPTALQSRTVRSLAPILRLRFVAHDQMRSMPDLARNRCRSCSLCQTFLLGDRGEVDPPRPSTCALSSLVYSKLFNVLRTCNGFQVPVSRLPVTAIAVCVTWAIVAFLLAWYVAYNIRRVGTAARCHGQP